MHVQGKIILIAVTFAVAIIGYGIPTSASADNPRAKLVSLINSAGEGRHGSIIPSRGERSTLTKFALGIFCSSFRQSGSTLDSHKIFSLLPQTSPHGSVPVSRM
jgi:hypothetical protein